MQKLTTKSISQESPVSDPYFWRDILKLVCFALVLLGFALVFVVTPALSTPTLLSIVFTMLFSPWVTAIERRGYPRWVATLILFIIALALTAGLSTWLLDIGSEEWDSFRKKAPAYFDASVDKIKIYEIRLKAKSPLFKNIDFTHTLLSWGTLTGNWFVEHGPSIAGSILSSIFIVPLLSFVLLNEGPIIRRRLFALVPNRYFELLYIVSNQVLTSLSDYLRAKLFEAFLVAILTSIGLTLVGAPYAIVLGLFAGITNIIPYLGPLAGALPGILIPVLDASHSQLLWPIVGVFLVVNIVDIAIIFPIVVAKLVNLHPLILIAAVALGGQYYGLVGMLISVPVATTIKVILGEIYFAVYELRIHRS